MAVDKKENIVQKRKREIEASETQEDRSIKNLKLHDDKKEKKEKTRSIKGGNSLPIINMFDFSNSRKPQGDPGPDEGLPEGGGVQGGAQHQVLPQGARAKLNTSTFPKSRPPGEGQGTLLNYVMKPVTGQSAGRKTVSTNHSPDAKLLGENTSGGRRF